MNVLQVWQSALLASWLQVSNTLLAFVPRLIGSIIIFVVGIVIASWGKRLIEELLKAVKLEDISHSSGFAKYLERAGVKFSASELVGDVIRWILLLVFFLAAVDVLGLTTVSQVLAQLLGYIPNVFASALIFGAGFVIANLADGLVRGAFATIDHEAARPVGRLARWVILVVAFFAAIDQLQIAESLSETFFQGLTYTLTLIFGLSIGLGAKDLVSKVLEDWYKRISK
ncbi:MAG: CmpX protein [Microgenomates group bacterium Gr01-1014_5]|nr:MAG: CmpX protein [Microgenomates group bacterium Gr01-1014_5]